MEVIAGAGVCAPVHGAPAYAEDEIYVVVSGRATFWTPAQAVPVAVGSAIFVPAHEPHRFTDFTEDLTTVVFFGPAEGSRA